jgi:hypothetical protein
MSIRHSFFMPFRVFRGINILALIISNICQSLLACCKLNEISLFYGYATLPIVAGAKFLLVKTGEDQYNKADFEV